jgi:hypothetical protein
VKAGYRQEVSAITKTGEEPSNREGPRGPSQRLRLLGIAPLMFFMAHLLFYVSDPSYASTDGVQNMLWMCNVGNLMLAAGLLLGSPRVIRLAVIWLVPGLPLWVFDAVLRGGLLFTSFLTHIGGLAVGLIAMRRVRADRWTWLYGLGWYLLVQQASRLLTSEYWNVNVSHRVYPGYEKVVSQYWQFWLLTSAMVAVGLFVLGFIMIKLFPPRAASSSFER